MANEDSECAQYFPDDDEDMICLQTQKDNPVLIAESDFQIVGSNSTPPQSQSSENSVASVGATKLSRTVTKTWGDVNDRISVPGFPVHHWRNQFKDTLLSDNGQEELCIERSPVPTEIPIIFTSHDFIRDSNINSQVSNERLKKCKPLLQRKLAQAYNKEQATSFESIAGVQSFACNTLEWDVEQLVNFPSPKKRIGTLHDL